MNDPGNTLHNTLGRITTRDILIELDMAIADHMVWLKNWHKDLICGDPPFTSELAYDPHHLCRFGSWYVKNQHKGLVDQPVIRGLASLHRDMHDRAGQLADMVRGGGSVTREKYDAFMDTASAFVAQARRLEKAFAAASSDLDPLTGLHNRKAMVRELETERARFLRTKRPCCIALGDLDNFKAINDKYGHGHGDKVLLAAADCFLGQLRSYDAVYRYGGEEFLFCLPDTDPATAYNAIDRLRIALEFRRIAIDSGGEMSATVSFGLAQMDEDSSLEETIKQADKALYRAKKEGRNRVCQRQPGDIA
jgi:diguanylate cyclase (GGDEF)-like protein